MQPKTARNDYTPKWRHFHPQSTVWVQNPFDHDVEFQVADEHNVPYLYKIQARKVAELPGGAIATLGIKAIVDELIQGNKKDVFLMWDAATRRKYEDDIILRIKEAPVMQEVSAGGEIDLTTSDEEFNAEDEEAAAAEPEEQPFAAARPQTTKPIVQDVDDGFGEPVVDPNPPAEDFEPAPVREPVSSGSGLPADPNVTSIAEASLAGKDNAIINEQ